MSDDAPLRDVLVVLSSGLVYLAGHHSLAGLTLVVYVVIRLLFMWADWAAADRIDRR